MVEIVGKGSTALVYHAIRLSDGEHVALKAVRALDKEMVDRARDEFDIVKSLKHPDRARTGFPCGDRWCCISDVLLCWKSAQHCNCMRREQEAAGDQSSWLVCAASGSNRLFASAPHRTQRR
jgi:serine/threonine protein kinase